MRWPSGCALLLCWLAAGAAADDGVFVESVFPPALQRGQVNRIVLRGVNMDHALGLWTSLPAELVESAQIHDNSTGQVVLDVDVADEAPLGCYGLRLATRDGLSNAHLFAIDQLRGEVETESREPERKNDQRQSAQPVKLPAAVFGTCTDADVDCFAIDVAAGERVAFEVVGNRLGKAFDPLLTIYRDDGEFIREYDNDPGLFFDCRFEHTFDTAGRFLVTLRDTRFLGSPHWTYVLRMGRFPVARVALPSTVRPGEASLVSFPQVDCDPRQVTFPAEHGTERFFFSLRGDEHNAPAWLPLTVSPLVTEIETEPNDLPDEATPVTVPGNLHGLLARRNDKDLFAFELSKGQRLKFRADTRDSGSAADLELILIAPDGRVVKTVDDAGFEDAAFEFTAQAAGRHLLEVVEVVGQYGPEYAYRIEVQERQPALMMSVETGRLAIPQGSWQPLPLRLTRQDFAGEVDLELVGAPPGMHLREAVIPGQLKEFAAALHADSETPPGIYTLQVVATATKADSSLRTVARTQPLIDRLPTGRGPHGEPFELREDQRRLPPSLTDRIAVVVLPPSPFDFHITTPLVTLPRYTQADLLIETSHADDFAGSVSFIARGGMLEYNRLQKPSVTAEIPVATRESPEIVATLRSGVNTSLTRHRVTVTGTAEQDGRKIYLTRTFELETRVAFAPTVEPQKIELPAGASAEVRLLANRLAPFDGPLTLTPEPPDGLDAPAEIELAAGQSEAAFEVSVAADTKPGSYKIKLPASTRIDKFFETGNGDALEVVVLPPSPEANE